MMQAVYGFLLAVQFLTRLPVPIECPWNEKTSRWAIRFYPFIGMLLGAILFGVGWFLAPFISPLLLSMVLISLWVWLTGGLHLDGLMDVADAVGSNAPLEKKWEIMKDPHVGSFGIIALFFLLIWKSVLLYSIVEEGPFMELFSLLVVLGAARFAAVALLVLVPAAKKQGLAWDWKKNLRKVEVVYAAIPLVLLLLFQPGYLMILPVLLIPILLYGLWVMRTFRGINGDLIGTAIEGGELWGLVIIWIFISFVTV
ncbi:adenosylcobinamide-GDP ribazoletransferase [Salipaludibacillus keqinensis]|uniref:Adenosylcobinamide-GDP ribazoletransferase n=1 Tax=Salipaludibacillus keqinensis TaxID=2045207 RepID=A0A323TDJ6_9BACI|nr:adenosylcobinamide-GDP ribazoletransferase [Salipaludibacillus keqinensis]PYZ92314.1 adenosylcobinamide-GDP ribazoletransferase [Salipaludibacillus keqinensis]